MWRDFRYAVNALWHSPIFTIAATLALGLAIGANATIFGLIDGLFLRPPGIERPRELTRVLSIQKGVSSRSGWSFPEYRDFQQVGAFSGVVARGGRGALLHEGGSPELLLVNVVSVNFFSVLGVKPAYGRLFAPGDERALEAERVVVLGHAFWTRRFGRDPSSVGRTLKLGRSGDVPVTVAGVLPASFRDLDPAGDRDLWLPPATWAALDSPQTFERRDDRWFSVFARRRAEREDAAQAEAAALVANWARDYPAHSAGRGVEVISDDSYRLRRGGVIAFALFALVGLVVLITCVNLANLILARAASRTREIATRVALGASRWRVARQMLAESIAIGILGTIAGLIVAMWLIRLIPVIMPPPPGMPSFVLFQVDRRVLAFTLVVSLATTLLFGLVPSWIGSRGDLVALIKGTASAGRRGGRSTRHALAIAQIAISLVLLTAAAVLMRSFLATRTMDIGFERKDILTAWCGVGYAAQETGREGVRRLAALPGAGRVAVAVRAPLSLSGGGMAQAVWLPDAPTPAGEGLPQVRFNAVSTNYFELMGTRILRGRAFSDADERPGEAVMIVNQAFADRFFPGTDAIDRRVRLRSTTGVDHRVVGIVENGVVSEITDKHAPYFFLPYWRGKYGDLTFFIEPAAGASPPSAASIRDALKAVHPSLEPRLLITMREYTDFAGGVYKATATLASALAALGLLLTTIGVYGVVAYTTARRTKEIGLRLALGAEPRGIISLVLRDGLRVAAIGVLIGAPIALWLNWLVGSILVSVAPSDVLGFAVATATLVASVSAATFVPAWRATRIAPSTALRTE